MEIKVMQLSLVSVNVESPYYFKSDETFVRVYEVMQNNKATMKKDYVWMMGEGVSVFIGAPFSSVPEKYTPISPEEFKTAFSKAIGLLEIREDAI